MSEPAETPAGEPEMAIERSEVVIRRAPRFSVFLTLGAVLGALAALVATTVNAVDPNVGFFGTFGYLMLYGVPFGLLLGAVAALIADAVSRRRARTVVAERGVVGNPDAGAVDHVDD